MTAVTRKHFLGGALAAALAPAVSSARESRSRRRPNVLLVIADEWRAQAFRYRGDSNARTPAFDRFAAESADFSQAISPAPVCCPARASLMTGQTPLTHGVYLNDVELKPKGTTLGEAFAAAGYQTGYIGKWHLHGSPDGRYGRRLAFVPPESRFGFQYWKAAECDHNYMHSSYYEGDDPHIKYWQGYDAIAQTADAETYIRKHAKDDQPYFLTLSWGPPHFPYMAPSPYKERWEGRPITLRPNVPEAEKADAIKELRGYYAAIEVLNDCFDRLMQAVKASGVEEDTIVVFMSDHGEMGYSHGLKYKNVPWDEASRVPFLVRYPRLTGSHGRRIPGLLSTPDIMPTLLGLAKIRIPKGVEGFDWSPAIAYGSAPNAPGSVFLNMMASYGTMRSDAISEYRGVRSARYTYVRSIKGPWLLYDNVADPYQQKNLVDDPIHLGTRRMLEADLDQWRKLRNDAFLPGIDYIRRDGLTQYMETAIPIDRTVSPDPQWQLTLSPSDPNTVPGQPGALEAMHRSTSPEH